MKRHLYTIIAIVTAISTFCLLALQPVRAYQVRRTALKKYPTQDPRVNSPTGELIVNGDFESGNTGFVSGYQYTAGSLLQAGVYDILRNPSTAHPIGVSFGDHTTGSGLMMAVNGSETAGLVVWTQIVPVSPETNYTFSVWVATWVSQSPASLQFKINEQVVGTMSAPITAGVWQQFTATWNSGVSSSVVIQVLDLNTAGSGNDFALDDFSFNRVTPAGEFTINITTFIPGNNMSAFPRRCRGSMGPAPFSRSLFVKTDDRSFDPDAVTYRTRHTVTVIPDESDDPDGIKDGAGVLPLTQATKLYARDALPVIDQADDDSALGDCSLLHAIEFPLVNNAQITPTRLGPKQVRVRLRGDVGTGAAFGLGLIADISWDVTLEIDTSGPSPRVTIQGRHDGFPAYEIYVNNQEIYRHNPGSPPYNLFDLLKLFPPMEVSIPQMEKVIQ